MNNNERLKLAIQHCAAIKHELDFSYGWLSQEKIDTNWVMSLKYDNLVEHSRKFLKIPVRE